MVEDSQRPYLLFLHDADVAPGPVGALDRLARVADVDVPRHPGFGGEDDALAADWDSVADLAQYHAERLRRAGAGTGRSRRAHLIGAGLGGWIALELAVRARELLASLCLVCPYGVKLSGPTEPEFADILLLDPDEVIELGWADPANPAARQNLSMPGYPPGADDAATARAFADRAALARVGWKPFLHDPRLPRWLHVLDLPTLVVSGAADRLVSPDHGRALAGLIPDAEHVVIPGCGHYPYLEAPEAFCAAVVPFVTAGVSA